MSRFLEFESLVRSNKPNNYLIAPEGLCREATPDAGSPSIALSPASLTKALIERFQSQKGWIQLDYDEENHRVRVVAVTSLLRFKDDVDIQILPDSEANGCKIAIYSRSRIGHSDLGANRKRVQTLISELPTA